MLETICSHERTARRRHWCNYCGSPILSGETYHFSKLADDGRVWTWKSHLRCKELARLIWDYVDPDEGMSAEEFRDGLSSVAGAFVCPECPHRIKDTDDCYHPMGPDCLNHIHAFFQDHNLVMNRPWSWICVPKKKGEGEG